MALRSLNARDYTDAQTSDEIEVILIKFTSPDGSEVLRFSSDTTELLEPPTKERVVYGTRSTWLTDNSEPFHYAPMSTMVPDDIEDAPPSFPLTFHGVGSEVIELLRSFTDQARVDIAIVLASSPNLPEYPSPWLDMRMISAEFAGAEITLQITREPQTSQPLPAHRMGRTNFPGLSK